MSVENSMKVMQDTNSKFLKDLDKMSKLFKGSFEKLARDMQQALLTNGYFKSFCDEPEHPSYYPPYENELDGINLARRMIEESRSTRL